MLMKPKFFLITLLLPFILFSCASKRERQILYSSSYNYEIQPAGVGSDGTKAVKVWGYGRSPEDAVKAAKRNAIAASIFQGIPAGPGVGRTPAIVTEHNADVKHADYFDEFFKTGGRYLSFIAMSTDGPPSGQDRLRIERNYYKVGVNVQILHDNLRRELENAGIARRLDHGF